MMDVGKIEPGRTYIGGKNAERRAIVRWGADQRWVCWAPERERLPYGGFMRTNCTSTGSFARWANEEVPASIVD